MNPVRLYRNWFFSPRFFSVGGILVAIFILSFFLPILFPLAQAGLVGLLIVSLFDTVYLFARKEPIEVDRQMARLLSMGDDNQVQLSISHHYALPSKVEIIDELPRQLQVRDFSARFEMKPGEAKRMTYTVRPLVRGSYHFGNANVMVSSPLGFVVRRHICAESVEAPVYPSIIQMKEMELKALQRISTQVGIKKIRRIGHSYEFEQIKNYVKGDDYRSINWKATGRRGELMVNQYEDERSQQVYSIIDKSRSMIMPFNGLSLMDYAINTSLVISNVALKKHDKAGLITFGHKVDTALQADRKKHQLRMIMESLYREKEGALEANYEMLYMAIRRFIKGRSLIFLYTNFESVYALQRVMPILRRINRLHLLVVMNFENTEIDVLLEEKASDLEGIYRRTIARKFMQEKALIAQEMRQYGINTLVSRPEDLSMNTVNKYLELKSRGLI
jgi:uncharacterized protein (DUF58 family)